jgi:hypothetical protein
VGARRWTLAALASGIALTSTRVESLAGSLQGVAWSGVVALIWFGAAILPGHASRACSLASIALALALCLPAAAVAAALDLARGAAASQIVGVLAGALVTLAALAWSGAARERTLRDECILLALFAAAPALELTVRTAALAGEPPLWLDVVSSMSPLRWAVARCELCAVAWSWRDAAALAGALAWLTWTLRGASAPRGAA